MTQFWHEIDGKRCIEIDINIFKNRRIFMCTEHHPEIQLNEENLFRLTPVKKKRVQMWQTQEKS